MSSPNESCRGCESLRHTESINMYLSNALIEQHAFVIQINNLLQDQQRQLNEVRMAVNQIILVTQIEILERVKEPEPNYYNSTESTP